MGKSGKRDTTAESIGPYEESRRKGLGKRGLQNEKHRAGIVLTTSATQLSIGSTKRKAESMEVADSRYGSSECCKKQKTKPLYF